MGIFAGSKLPLINNASGGTVTEVIGGDLIYRVHSFTNVGVSTFTVPIAISGSNIEYLIVAGGGAAGLSPYPYGAGGGAGGYRSSVQGESSGGNSPAEPKINLSAGSYEIVVGAGGTGVNTNIRGNNGQDSSAFGIISKGGGGGGGQNNRAGLVGGSGGGSTAHIFTQTAGTSGQGNAGGQASCCGGGGGSAGGGGAGTAGQVSAGTFVAGVAGNGLQSFIRNSSGEYFAGGGAGVMSVGTRSGGLGGGGASTASGSGGSGSPNTGGGGGATVVETWLPAAISGSGGSGIVIVRYPIGIVGQ